MRMHLRDLLCYSLSHSVTQSLSHIDGNQSKISVSMHLKDLLCYSLSHWVTQSHRWKPIYVSVSTSLSLRPCLYASVSISLFYLCTISPLSVHYLSNIWTLSLHSLCTISSLPVYSLCTTFAPSLQVTSFYMHLLVHRTGSPCFSISSCWPKIAQPP